VAGVVALVLPVCGALWWVGHGTDDPVRRVETATVPAYMDAAADRDPADGTLVLRGGRESGVTAEVRRGDALTLGEEVLVSSDGAQLALTEAVGDLLTAPSPRTPADLARSGVAFVFIPAPVDAALAAALDAVPSLEAASADDAEARAWRLDEETVRPDADPGDRDRLRPLLLLVQALSVVVVLVLAAPSRRSSR
jgi:hypothetical protein